MKNAHPTPLDQEVVTPGCRITLHYAITLEDGMVADATVGESPIEFELGDGTLHPHLERLLLGRHAGDHDVVTVPPEHGFGHHNPTLVQTLSRSEFPESLSLTPGAILGFTTPAGDELPGTVLEIGGETVTIDFNHPFAGHTLTIGLQILAIENPFL